MKVLVLNCGSSSLKYQLFDMTGEEVLAKGLVERIGMAGSLLKHQGKGPDKHVIEQQMKDHKDAIQLVLTTLVHSDYGVIYNLNQIDAIGHRVVHGGEKFSASIVIDEAVMGAINDCVTLAPLHNPPNIMGIEACQKLVEGTPQVAVFDTAFHQTMEPKTFLYGLPYEYYEKHGIRKYGFHGTSHKYVSQRTAQVMGRPIEELRIITCHLGNGSSIAAVDKGVSVDTSMGFTPLEGLLMGTRCGDIDPAIVPFVMEKENLDSQGINDVLNKKSGVLGLSGLSSDFRDLEEAAEQGNARAELALDIFANDVKKYIGTYMAVLGGVDAIVFTAGVGENSDVIRAKVCAGLEELGVAIDAEANNVRGKEKDIATADSKIRVFVIPTNEELMIARDTKNLVQK